MHSGILRVAVLALVVVVVAGGMASAQWAQPQDKNEGYFARVGLAFPLGDVEDDSMPIVGGGWYGPVGTAINENAVYGLTVDWTRVERFDGDEINLFPVLFKYGQHMEIGAIDLFGHIGLGIIYADDSVPEMDLDNSVNLGWDAGLDLELTERVEFGLRFLASDSPEDDGMVIGEIALRF